MSTVQIIGGSGFIGGYLIDKLQSSYKIKNFDKNQSERHNSMTSIADIRNKNSLGKLDNSEWVILLAAEHRDDVSPVSNYYDVNVKGTQNVLDTMKEKKINKIIFTSTVAVYGLNKKNPDETSTPDPFNDYGKSKLQAEEVLKKWFEEDKENRTLIILRPTVIFGPGNKGNVYSLLQQIASGKFMMIGNGNNKKSMAYVENVASFIKYCVDKNLMGLQVYNYVDKPDLSTKELVEVAEKFLNKKLPPVRIPYVIGFAGGLVFDFLSLVTRKKFSISSVRVKKFCATTEFNSDKLLKTDFTPTFSLEEGLDKTLRSLK